MNSKQYVKSTGNGFLILIVFLLCAILGLFLHFKFSIEQEYKSYTQLLQKYNKSDSLVIYITPDLQKYVSLKESKYLVVNRDDLEFISNKIGVEIDKLKNNASLYISQIENDIDRLNLFTTIAVFLLGLIGTIYPLFFNYISKNDIKEKVDFFDQKINQDKAELNQKYNKVEDKLSSTSTEVKEYTKIVEEQKNSSEKLLQEQKKISREFETFNKSFQKEKEEAVKIKGQMKTVEDKIEEAERKLPEINLLSLQNSVNRLLNINQARFLNSIRGNGRLQYLSDLINTIISSIENCSKDKLIEKQKSYLEKILNDFKIGLANNSFQTVLNRKGIRTFQQFQRKLEEATDDPKFNENSSQHLNTLKNKMDEMVKELNDVENEDD